MPVLPLKFLSFKVVLEISNTSVGKTFTERNRIFKVMVPLQQTPDPVPLINYKFNW